MSVNASTASVDDSSGRNATCPCLWTSMAPAWRSSRRISRHVRSRVSPFLTFLNPPQIPRLKHPPPCYLLLATTATSQVSMCVSLISSFPRACRADAAITDTVHRSTHGAQVARQERLRSRQESGTLSPPSPLLVHPTPDAHLFLFHRVPAPQRTTSPPKGSVPIVK